MLKRSIYASLLLLLFLCGMVGCKQEVPSSDIHSEGSFQPTVHHNDSIQIVPITDLWEPIEEQIQTVSAKDAKTLSSFLSREFTEDGGCMCYGDVWIRVDEETFMYHYSGSITVFGYNEEHSGTLRLTEKETAQITALIQKYLPAE